MRDRPQGFVGTKMTNTAWDRIMPGKAILSIWMPATTGSAPISSVDNRSSRCDLVLVEVPLESHLIYEESLPRSFMFDFTGIGRLGPETVDLDPNGGPMQQLVLQNRVDVGHKISARQSGEDQNERGATYPAERAGVQFHP